MNDIDPDAITIGEVAHAPSFAAYACQRCDYVFTADSLFYEPYTSRMLCWKCFELEQQL